MFNILPRIGKTTEGVILSLTFEPCFGFHGDDTCCTMLCLHTKVASNPNLIEVADFRFRRN